MKIAIFHPWLKSKGGAENFVLKLIENRDYEIDIYTWVYDAEGTFPEFKNYNIKVITPKIFEKISKMHFLRGLFIIFGLFKKIPLEKYDKFLISTSGVAEFILFRNYKKHNTYAYVHTPLREATPKIVDWNLKNRNYSFVKKQMYLLLVKIYNYFEKKAWRKIDIAIFNSNLTKQRAIDKKLIKNDKTKVVYCIDTLNMSPSNNKKSKNYFLYVSRINTPKRQDVLVEAWKLFYNKNKKYKLIIAGNVDDNKLYNKIKENSANINLEIKTNLSKENIIKLYSECKAGIFLGYEEDLGLVPFEVISYNKPLIAVNRGGFTEILNKNKLFFKIKEKDEFNLMVKETNKAINYFLKQKLKSKINKIHFKNNFADEIYKIIS